MIRARYAILKRLLDLLTISTLLTISSLSGADESNANIKSIESDENITIEFPQGRTIGSEKCFKLDAYKSLAIIYAHYMACESQRTYVFDLMSTLDEKQDALQQSANDLAFSLTTLERERDAMVVAATTNAEKAEIEERRKRAWRGFAIGGIIVSLALGAVIVGFGVAK